ncbi:DNA polymerase III PolC-type [uncultured archaeon]|nr:DNA polymerase III PolC-type [uncultured archaeon]
MALAGEYVVVDIETTGLSRVEHRITEIAAVKVLDGAFLEEFQTLVNPLQHIPSFITHLTGIDDEMVASAPTIKEVLPHFVDFMGQDVLVAHNASFDHGFLSHNASVHIQAEFENPKLCTRKLASRLLPNLPSKKLSCVCDHLNVRNVRAHRAMGDAYATAEVFQKFIPLLENHGAKTLPDIIKFERTPRKKLLINQP